MLSFYKVSGRHKDNKTAASETNLKSSVLTPKYHLESQLGPFNHKITPLRLSFLICQMGGDDTTYSSETLGLELGL